MMYWIKLSNKSVLFDQSVELYIFTSVLGEALGKSSSLLTLLYIITQNHQNFSCLGQVLQREREREREREMFEVS